MTLHGEGHQGHVLPSPRQQFRAGTANQTDAQGNPLVDELELHRLPQPGDGRLKADGATPTSSTATRRTTAWADLWFYSNPIFLNVK